MRLLSATLSRQATNHHLQPFGKTLAETLDGEAGGAEESHYYLRKRFLAPWPCLNKGRCGAK